MKNKMLLNVEFCDTIIQVFRDYGYSPAEAGTLLLFALGRLAGAQPKLKTSNDGWSVLYEGRDAFDEGFQVSKNDCN